ncbi:hypothetical protein [Pseudomonas monteilii]|uniref:hypothetical protein n=1 Tax=Pseudomonas monteilii TaxID=76759 RepID=UPI00383B2DDB
MSQSPRDAARGRTPQRRGPRDFKYYRLLRIEEALNGKATRCAAALGANFS